MFEFITFITIFTYITNWKRFQFLPQVLFHPKNSLKSYNDKSLVEKLSKKLGTKFEIKIQDSPVINGYMPGIPKKPVMILMQGALDKLSKKELEWVILHEAGHCLRWHTVKNFIGWVVTFTFGIALILNFLPSPFGAIMIALILGIIWIQIERRSEVEADRFALEQGADPKAMISFFQKVNKENSNIIYHNEVLGLLFSTHPNYKRRIAMAQNYL